MQFIKFQTMINNFNCLPKASSHEAKKNDIAHKVNSIIL